nr:type IV secretory system conjugative DNA transfer family protein [Methylocucumis oryzae]
MNTVLRWLGGLFSSKDDEPHAEEGAADIATLEEVGESGLLTGAGIPIGYEIDFLAWKKSGVESFPDSAIRWAHYAGENHLFTVGKPGSGKGTTVIVPALLTFGGSCIVIDPKGQNAAITARARGLLGHKVFILNPYNVLADHLNGKGAHVVNRAGFNPLDRIKPESDSFVADVRSLAQALIVDSGNGDSHWPDAARELVAALIMHICLTALPERRNLGEVRALLSSEASENQEDVKEVMPSPWELLIDEMMESPFQPLRQKAAQFAHLTKEVQSIISTARTQLAFLDDPAICAALAKSDFSFADLKREKITVYLVLPFKQLEAQGRWLRLLITAAIEELTEEPRPNDGRVLFILDEFAQLGRLPAIERALALVRGYGVQLWPFVQDLPQLKSIYSERWASFLSSAGVVQFFDGKRQNDG